MDLDLNTVINLFESKHTAGLADRQATAIVQLCKSMVNEDQQRGFVFRELPQVARVLELINGRLLDRKYEMIEALLSILDVLKVPFVKELASDELSQVPNMPLPFNALCKLLKMEIPFPEDQDISLEETEHLQTFDQAKCEIANTISAIASEGVTDIKEQEASIEDKMLYGAASSPMKRLYEKGTRNLIAISKSEVPETLVSMVASGTRSKDLLISVVEAIGATSLYIRVAERYAYMGVMKDLVRIFEESPDFRSYAVSIAMDAIWNLVEVCGQKAVQSMAGDQTVVVNLRGPFENVIQKGYKLDDKCLRNELAILINYVVMEKVSHPFFFEKDPSDGRSLFQVLMHYATVDEFYSIDHGDNIQPGQEKWVFTTNDEDIELKKLLWTTVLYASRDSDCQQAHKEMMDANFLNAILMYLNPQTNSPQLHRWQPPQLQELQIHGLSLICNLLPLIPEYIHSLNTHRYLVKMIQVYQDYERRIAAMKAILQASKFEFFKSNFNNSGLVDVLLEIIDQGTDVHLDLREYAFCILSNLCQDNRDNQKEFRRKKGIEYLKKNLAYAEVEQTGNASTFLLSVIDCLSNAVFGNKRSELHFLDIEGVYILLDLAENCEQSLKRLVLSSVCTILENPKSFQYFVEWNSSKTTINASQLLVRLFGEEDKRFGVKVDSGILQDTERPLNPNDSYYFRKRKEEGEDGIPGMQMEIGSSDSPTKLIDGGGNANGGTARIGQSQSSMRQESGIKASRSLHQALKAADKQSNNTDSHLARVMNEYSKSFDIRAVIFGTFYRCGFDLHELTPTEKQLMEIIQLYPYLKNGEIWRDIAEFFEDKNIRPTSDDKHWMETCIEESREQTEAAIYDQQVLAGEMRQKEQEELDRYYAAIRLKNELSNQQKGPARASQKKAPK